MTIRVMFADDELLARKRLTRLLSAMPDVELIGAFDSADALLAALADDRPDALLLDIHMPGLTGLEAAGLLPEPRPHIIFCTAHADHALEAFEHGAVDYVMKPIEAKRLATALSRVRPRVDAQTPSNAGAPAAAPDEAHLAVKTRKGVVLVDIATISHAVLDGETVKLCTDDASYFCEYSLGDLEQRLAGRDVMRVHRRALCHIGHIELLEPASTGGYSARMKNGDVLTVSRAAARDLRKRFAL